MFKQNPRVTHCTGFCFRSCVRTLNMSSALSRDTHGQSPALSAAGAALRGRPRARASRGTGQNSNSPSPRVPVPGSRCSTGPTTSDTSRTSQVESGLLVAGRLPPGHDVLGGVHAAAHGRSSNVSGQCLSVWVL